MSCAVSLFISAAEAFEFGYMGQREADRNRRRVSISYNVVCSRTKILRHHLSQHSTKHNNNNLLIYDIFFLTFEMTLPRHAEQYW